MTLVGGELLSELPSTSPLVSDDDGGLGWPGVAPLEELLCRLQPSGGIFLCTPADKFRVLNPLYKL